MSYLLSQVFQIRGLYRADSDGARLLCETCEVLVGPDGVHHRRFPRFADRPTEIKRSGRATYPFRKTLAQCGYVAWESFTLPRFDTNTALHASLMDAGDEAALLYDFEESSRADCGAAVPRLPPRALPARMSR